MENSNQNSKPAQVKTKNKKCSQVTPVYRLRYQYIRYKALNNN